MITTPYLPSQDEEMFSADVDKKLKVCITIPARNEEKLIERTLNALYHQYHSGGTPIDKNMYEVLILTNNCEDQTSCKIRDFAKRHPHFQLYVEDFTFPEAEAHIGKCRRLLMDAALRRLLSINRADGFIISTDADTQADPFWLHHILAEFEQGCDVVGGRIISTSEDPHTQYIHARDERYRLLCTKLEAFIAPIAHDPWPRHFQCFGPSTAVTCSIYQKVGRMPLLPFLEDAIFMRNLICIDAKIRHSPKVKVHTSGRLNGRAVYGFSKQLQEWKAMNERGDRVTVEPVDALRTKIFAKKKLHYYFQYKQSSFAQKQIHSCCKGLFVSDHQVSSLLQSSVYFGSFWEGLLESMDMKQWVLTYPLIPIEEAIKNLEKEFHDKKAA